MSKKDKPVPRLDLAPKLKRPLSLWNPLDYLRLLYWVFFFPQAVRRYVEKFGDGFIFYPKVNWRKGWNFLRDNPTELKLLFQGLCLIVFTHLILRGIFQIAGIPIEGYSLWLVMIISVVASLASGLGLGVAPGVTIGIVFALMLLLSTVASELAIALASALPASIGDRVILQSAIAAIIRGICWAVAFNTTICLAISVGSRQIEEMLNRLEEPRKKAPKPLNLKEPIIIFFIVSIALWLLPNILLGDVAGILEDLVLLVTTFAIASVAGVIAFLRPENWLFGLPWVMRSLPNKYRMLPRVTPIPVPYLSYQLKIWLRNDWETGLENANQLLAYTFQFFPVVGAVNQVLKEIPPEEILFRVAQLAEDAYSWKLFYYTCHKSRLTKTEINLGNNSSRAAAGFWYLHQKEPDKATEAFALVRRLPYGEEMFVLAQTLASFYNTKELETIANLKLPPLPTEPLLRPNTWEAIKSFQRVKEDTQIIVRSLSRTARSLAVNRAQAELTKILDNIKNILDNIETIPQAERELIKEIAQTWQKALLELTAEVGEVNITKPVRIPYTIGDPVVGKKFVGREDIIRELQQRWVLSDHPQSVLLFGHRRMGKTSILLNIANILGAKIQLAYVNLQGVGETSQGLAEVMMSITDAVSSTLDVPPPADEDLLNLPYLTVERYLHQVIANLDGALIVALDEFEQIEELMSDGYIPKNFMKRLRRMAHMSPKLAFALAGLHTLEEMTEDYFHPFYTFNSIRVSFLSHGATRQILANPGDEDFLLDYQPEALDRIYELTHGQPYLVQLVGFLLVRRYNELTFETGRPQKNIFTIQDVEAVIDNPDFYSHGRYYFTGVWDQAARGAKGQQQILTALAPHQKEGLTLPALKDATGTDTPNLQTAIETLERHDVVKRDGDNRWQIAVELLRRWVAANR